MFRFCRTFLIFAFLLATWVSATASSASIIAPNKAAENEAATDQATSDETAIQETVQAYFSARYEGLKTKAPFDLSELVDDAQSATEVWLAAERQKRTLENFIHQTYGAILETTFQLDFQTIEVQGGRASVRLLAHETITYAANASQPAATANLAHLITLSRGADGWRIVSDQYSDDMTRLLNSLSIAQALKNVQANYKQSAAPSQAPPLITGRAPLLVYDRSAALRYAEAHWDTITAPGAAPAAVQSAAAWQPAWPTIYKTYASDCTNFLSQAVFEGVNHVASETNPFYPDAGHYDNGWYYKFSAGVDGSKPWVNVGAMRQFLTANYYNAAAFGLAGRGPAGYGVDLCRVQAGDLIFMQAGGQWKHAVMVTQVRTNPCNGAGVYVAAHSDDSHQRPLFAYSGYRWYVVAVRGYFE